MNEYQQHVEAYCPLTLFLSDTVKWMEKLLPLLPLFSTFE